jgi:hypothetical protein
MIIRAWVEVESAEPLRAHVRVTDDLSTGIEHTSTVARAIDVRELIDQWLRRVVAAGTADE